MIEFDFDTEQGRLNAKTFVNKIIKEDNKEDIAKLIYAMLEFIVQHEIKFNNLKNI